MGTRDEGKKGKGETVTQGNVQLPVRIGGKKYNYQFCLSLGFAKVENKEMNA